MSEQSACELQIELYEGFGVSNSLPFTVSSRPWDRLSDRERGFLRRAKRLGMPPNYAAQIRLVDADDAEQLFQWGTAALPEGWPDATIEGFPHEEVLDVSDCWSTGDGHKKVMRWLFDRGIPFSRSVYLLYGPRTVVETKWKIAVHYWDALVRTVGTSLLIIDHTRQWVGCYRHDDRFLFGSHVGFRSGRAPSDPEIPVHNPV